MGSDAPPDSLYEYYAEDPRMLSDAARDRICAATGQTRVELDADIELAGVGYDQLNPDELTREDLGFPPVPRS